jgi:hypothetical protein
MKTSAGNPCGVQYETTKEVPIAAWQTWSSNVISPWPDFWAFKKILILVFNSPFGTLKNRFMIPLSSFLFLTLFFKRQKRKPTGKPGQGPTAQVALTGKRQKNHQTDGHQL